MKHFYLYILTLLLSICTNFYAQTDTITILHVNDSHSCLAALGPRNANLTGTQGGISRTATLIGLTKMTEQNVLTLHGGDVFIGDLFFNKFFGVAEFQLMVSLGFDAMAVGNHEFDLTPSILDTALRNSFPPGYGFKLISSNLILEDPEVQPLKDYIFPFTTKQFGNTKVGIFSLLTPETNLLSQPMPAVVDTNIAQITIEMIDTLTSLGCNFIICLSHLGIYYDQELAANIPGINLIISAHDHLATEIPFEITNPLGKTTCIVQADAFYKYIGKLKFAITNNEVELLNYELIHLDENIPEEPNVKSIVDGLITEIENQWGPVYSQQIGYATDYFEEVTSNLTENGPHDTPIGNLVTDAFLWKTGTEIAITVGGSTAQPVFAGPLVAADVFRVVGYGFNEVNGLGFRIIKFKLSGADIIAGLEFGVSMAEYNDELFPQVSGMSYSYDLSRPVGSRIIYAEAGGSPLNPEQEYTVTANEFLVFALSNPSIIGSEINIIDPYLFADSSEFQVLTDYIITQQTISPIHRGSIIAGVENNNPENIPEGYFLSQNYPNPFNPNTKISWQSPVGSHQTLKIYDVLGNEVATLVDEYKPAGNYEVEWNASGFASGVYFYKIQADNFIRVKKMVLMK